MIIPDGPRGSGAAGPPPNEPESAGFLAIRSFVVRALLERREETETPRWRGQITDVSTGARQGWSEVRDVSRFIASRLASSEVVVDAMAARVGGLMAAPPLTDVVTDMLAVLEARLPPPSPPLPDPNITIERVRERLVGVGGMRGLDSKSSMASRTLRGGRLDARVRFQLWSSTPGGVDDAVVALHGTMLDHTDQLRVDGFLKLTATDTTVAEHVPTVDGWRKTASYDVLYEYAYADADAATSLIARIPVNTDLEEADSADRETETVTDELVRWDDELAPPLVIAGPATVSHVDLLAFVPGPSPSGTVTILRTTRDAAGSPTHLPDLPTFLAAVGGDVPAETHADVSLSPTALLAAFSPRGEPIELGDWNADLVADSYDGFHLDVAPGIQLSDPAHRLQISYSDPDGLDEQAVLYVRVNAP